MKSWEREKMVRDEGIAEGIRIGQKQGIEAFILLCQELSLPRSETADRIIEKFGLSAEKAAAYLDRFWPVS